MTTLLREFCSSRPASAGIVRWPNGIVTLIAKLVLTLDERGVFVPSPPPVTPLLLDVTDPSGELLYPSDYAPFKAHCDVVVTGGAVRHRGPGKISIGYRQFMIADNESLGAQPGLCPRGDPLDPAIVTAWASGALDMSKFQSSPSQRKLPHPTAPFSLAYERGGVRLRGQFEGPFARGIILSLDGASVIAQLSLAADTFCIAPEHGRITVIYRAVYDRKKQSNEEEGLFAIDFEPTPVGSPSAIARWPRGQLAEPREGAGPASPPGTDVRGGSLAATRASAVDNPPDRGTVIAPSVTAGPVMPFRPQGGPESVRADARAMAETSMVTTTPVDQTPFVRSSSPTSKRFSSQDLHELKNSGPVAPASARMLGGTMIPSRELIEASLAASAPLAPPPAPPPPAAAPLRAPVAAPLPPPPPPPVAVPLHMLGGAAPVRLAATPAATSATPPASAAAPAFAPPPVPPPPPAPSAGPLDEERVRAIMQEIWAGGRSKEEILASNGLTDAEWRVARRKYLK